VARSDLEDDYLTVADVAGLLKLNQQTVRNWIDQGKLPALRVGRRVRIKRADLERLLADGYSGGVASAARASGPSAEDFWGGEAFGIAEPAPLPESTRFPPSAALPQSAQLSQSAPASPPAPGGDLHSTGTS
jgi:excisionase family DNA binding protein